MNVPGGKELEQAYCPDCKALVAEHSTSGFLSADPVPDGPSD